MKRDPTQRPVEWETCGTCEGSGERQCGSDLPPYDWTDVCLTCKGEKAVPRLVERRGVMPTFRAMVEEMDALTKAPFLRRLHERAEEVEQLQSRVHVLETRITATAHTVRFYESEIARLRGIVADQRGLLATAQPDYDKLRGPSTVPAVGQANRDAHEQDQRVFAAGDSHQVQ